MLADLPEATSNLLLSRASVFVFSLLFFISLNLFSFATRILSPKLERKDSTALALAICPFYRLWNDIGNSF